VIVERTEIARVEVNAPAGETRWASISKTDAQVNRHSIAWRRLWPAVFRTSPAHRQATSCRDDGCTTIALTVNAAGATLANAGLAGAQ